MRVLLVGMWTDFRNHWWLPVGIVVGLLLCLFTGRV